MADTTKKASVQIVNEEQENMAVTEMETTEEENKTLIRMNEDDFIQGLISAADYAKDDTQRIEIARNGKVLFKYVRNKQFGMKLPEETNTVKFRDALIYTATVEADREKLWDNKKVWESLRAKDLQIMNGLDVIEYCLKAGEKDKIIECIDSLSGFEENIEEVAKNS